MWSFAALSQTFSCAEEPMQKQIGLQASKQVSDVIAFQLLQFSSATIKCFTISFVMSRMYLAHHELGRESAVIVIYSAMLIGSVPSCFLSAPDCCIISATKLHSIIVFPVMSLTLQIGCRWIPPAMTLAGTHHQTAAQRGGEAKDKDKPLSDTQRDRCQPFPHDAYAGTHIHCAVAQQPPGTFFHLCVKWQT